MRGDLAGVVEHRRVDVAVDHDAPLGLQHQAVAIAEAPARIPAQRRAAADRRQHEERNLLAALQPGRRHAPRNESTQASRRIGHVLHRFVVDLLEAVEIVRIAEIVKGDAVESAAARVSGRRPRIDADRRLGVQVGDLRAEAGQGLRRVDLFDRGNAPEPDVCSHSEASTPARSRSTRRVGRTVSIAVPYGCLKPIIGSLLLRAVGAEAEEADLGRFPPAGDDRQHPAPIEEPRREKLPLDPLVAARRDAAAYVERAVRPDVGPVARTNGEPAA